MDRHQMGRLLPDNKPGKLEFPKREEDFIPIFQREGQDVVLLVDGKSYRLTEAQARHVQKDLNRMFGHES